MTIPFPATSSIKNCHLINYKTFSKVSQWAIRKAGRKKRCCERNEIFSLAIIYEKPFSMRRSYPSPSTGKTIFILLQLFLSSWFENIFIHF